MVISEPPCAISGSSALAMRRKLWQETFIAESKPASDASMTRPCRSSALQKAIEWMAKSISPKASPHWAMTPSRQPGSATSSLRKSLAPRASASGWVYLAVFSFW